MDQQIANFSISLFAFYNPPCAFDVYHCSEQKHTSTSVQHLTNAQNATSEFLVLFTTQVLLVLCPRVVNICHTHALHRNNFQTPSNPNIWAPPRLSKQTNYWTRILRMEIAERGVLAVTRSVRSEKYAEILYFTNQSLQILKNAICPSQTRKSDFLFAVCAWSGGFWLG